jgi:hypothetical protein
MALCLLLLQLLPGSQALQQALFILAIALVAIQLMLVLVVVIAGFYEAIKGRLEVLKKRRIENRNRHLDTNASSSRFSFRKSRSNSIEPL